MRYTGLHMGPHESSISSDVHRFFKGSCVDFSQLDGAPIAKHFSAPCISLNADGWMRAFDDHAQIAQHFQRFPDRTSIKAVAVFASQGCNLIQWEAGARSPP